MPSGRTLHQLGSINHPHSSAARYWWAIQIMQGPFWTLILSGSQGGLSLRETDQRQAVPRLQWQGAPRAGCSNSRILKLTIPLTHHNWWVMVLGDVVNNGCWGIGMDYLSIQDHVLQNSSPKTCKKKIEIVCFLAAPICNVLSLWEDFPSS